MTLVPMEEDLEEQECARCYNHYYHHYYHYHFYCKVCGKEGSMAHIMGHIESFHVTGISIPCNLCGYQARTRNALGLHKSKSHKRDVRSTLYKKLTKKLPDGYSG